MSGLWPRLSFAPLDQPVALTGFHLSKFVLEEVSIKPDGMKGREREVLNVHAKEQENLFHFLKG